MMDKATPRPWRIIANKGDFNQSIWIGSEPFHSICEVRNGAEDDEYGGEEAERANAALIVKAVNNFDDLVAVLEQIAIGEGVYGAQAHEYKQIARAALTRIKEDGS